MARRPPGEGEAIIAINPQTKRVGCVLLQAVMGGDQFFVQSNFDPAYWTTNPDGLEMFRLGEHEVDKLKELIDAEGS